MDKNTITGLVLIAILLVGFSFLSRPSKEQLEHSSVIMIPLRWYSNVKKH